MQFPIPSLESISSYVLILFCSNQVLSVVKIGLWTNRKGKREKEPRNRALRLLLPFYFGRLYADVSENTFRGKLKPPAEEVVLKITRYAQRLTQGYSVYGGSS